MLAAPFILTMIRSLFLGVYVNNSTVKITSWWWTYRIDRSTIRAIQLANYDGWTVLWTGGTGDLYTTNVLMIVLVYRSGRERAYQATAMWHATAKRAAEELSAMLEIEYAVGPRRKRRRDAAARARSR